VLRGFSREKNSQYAEFLENAPGIDRGKLEFKAPEHDFSERLGLSLIAKMVKGAENWLMACIGVEVG
jgi:hypothetical protein